MTSGPELERFLAQLDERRERVLRLAGPAGVQADDLVAELEELSQQLIVADEELRVQQEELERARDALTSIGARRDLLDAPQRSSALTDGHGVVVDSTPELRRLIKQPSAQLTPRPIATWFEVADRASVRGMIGRVTAVGVQLHADLVRIRTRDGELIPVRAAVEGVADPISGKLLLRWDLVAVEVRHLRAVPDPLAGGTPAPAEVVAPDGPGLPLLLLADAAVELAGCADTDDLSVRTAAAAVRLLPEADFAGVILRLGRTSQATQGATSETAAAVDAAQLVAGSGPAIAALAGLGPRHDVLHGQPWLQATPLAAERPVAALSVPIVVRGQTVGVLSSYAVEADRFDQQSELVATVLAGHAALALVRLTETGDLREVMTARQLVGRAQGILVERHRLTAAAAHAVLVRHAREADLPLRDVARFVVETGQDPSQIDAS